MNKMTLGHEEVWDDSALVSHWDDAVKEYQKYHSISAKGATVDEVEKALEESRPQSDAKPETNDTSEPIEIDEAEVTAPPVLKHETPSEVKQQKESQLSSGPVNHSRTAAAVPGGGGLPSTAGFGPQTVLGTVQDEGLRQLLMSWYYAGYYTGLYQGKQEAQQQ